MNFVLELEDAVSVVVIFLMLSAVMVMVKNADKEHAQPAVLAPRSTETEDPISPEE
ncbi:MAG: hypothetical protein ACRD3H_01520 [Terriglobales bacterium]